MYVIIIWSWNEGVTISSDFISGFCGETQEEHEETVSLMKLVQYDMAYMFAYSMRKVRQGFNLSGIANNFSEAWFLPVTDPTYLVSTTLHVYKISLW